MRAGGREGQGDEMEGGGGKWNRAAACPRYGLPVALRVNDEPPVPPVASVAAAAGLQNSGATRAMPKFSEDSENI